MNADVLCLRPEQDFLAVGVTPPEGLTIAYRGPSDRDVPDLMGSAKALVIPAVGPALDPELFRGSGLRLVQVTGAGLDRVDQNVLRKEGIALANVPGGSNAALAEYVIANALALKRGFFAASAPLRAGHYAEHRAAMVKASLCGLGGLTVGLLGMGTIGLAVAERCRQMGAGIIYHDPAPPRDTARIEALEARSCDLGELFETADVVTLHVPLIDATRNLVDAALLSRMKPDAVLINAARGGIVDEIALAAAIEDRRLGGAAVDVYSTEPPAPDNPLLTVSDAAAARLILTPHIAGVSRQASQFLFQRAWDNVVRVLIHGQAPENAVIDGGKANADQ